MLLPVVSRMHYRRPKYQHMIPRTFARRSKQSLGEPELHDLCCPRCGGALMAERFRVRRRMQREVWCRNLDCEFGIDEAVTFTEAARLV